MLLASLAKKDIFLFINLNEFILALGIMPQKSFCFLEISLKKKMANELERPAMMTEEAWKEGEDFDSFLIEFF